MWTYITPFITFIIIDYVAKDEHYHINVFALAYERIYGITDIWDNDSSKMMFIVFVVFNDFMKFMKRKNCWYFWNFWKLKVQWNNTVVNNIGVQQVSKTKIKISQTHEWDFPEIKNIFPWNILLNLWLKFQKQINCTNYGYYGTNVLKKYIERDNCKILSTRKGNKSFTYHS